MRGVLFALLIASFAAASTDPAWSAPRGEVFARGDAVFTTVRDDRRGRGREARRFLPLEAVLANVARNHPGHHLSVDGPFERNGRWVYRIKWLTPDGRVLIVFADAETGQVLGSRGGR